MPTHEFQLRMHQRGYDGVGAARALAALERRGWVSRRAGILEATAEALAAASRNSGRPPAPRRARNARMPRGLFG